MIQLHIWPSHVIVHFYTLQTI